MVRRLCIGIVVLQVVGIVLVSGTFTYTKDDEFDQGRKYNVDHYVKNQLQLPEGPTPTRYVWASVSTKNTIVKVNIDTGAVEGEYWSAPRGGVNTATDPSRTTVDANGNVWTANRKGTPSVVKIGLLENGQCEDRNGNGVIDTSHGLGDVKPWSGSDDPEAIISTATDECITHYVTVSTPGTRHIAVDRDNNIWVSGRPSGAENRNFDVINGDTGKIIRTYTDTNHWGGYGGLITRDYVIWSAKPLMRWDTVNQNLGDAQHISGDSYGLCWNRLTGDVWNTQGSGGVSRRFAANGTLIGTYSHGNARAQGCGVDFNGHIWVAHSLVSNSVGHLDGSGNLIGVVTVNQGEGATDAGPTGVAIDANNKVWVTNYRSGTMTRIDPKLRDGKGDVDLHTEYLGGSLYNYSDMTGSAGTAPPAYGTWIVAYDSRKKGTEWRSVSWSEELNGGKLQVFVSSRESESDPWSQAIQAENKGRAFLPHATFIQVEIRFVRGSPQARGESESYSSPILYDMSVDTNGKEPPVWVLLLFAALFLLAALVAFARSMAKRPPPHAVPLGDDEEPVPYGLGFAAIAAPMSKWPTVNAGNYIWPQSGGGAAPLPVDFGYLGKPSPYGRHTALLGEGEREVAQEGAPDSARSRCCPSWCFPWCP